MTPRAPTAPAPSGASCSTPGGALRALLRLGHTEHPSGFEVDDLRVPVATHDRGDDLDPFSPFLTAWSALSQLWNPRTSEAYGHYTSNERTVTEANS